jgi:hypothetical protein
LNQERKKKGRWIVLRKDTRAKAEVQLTIVEFDESILAAICGLVGPRANTQAYVRFGSQADICSAKSHVRFATNSDRESGLRQTAMSALPQKRTCAVALSGHSHLHQ